MRCGGWSGYSIACKKLGVYDDSLIIVSSDHGIGYAPRKFVNDRQTPAGALSTLSGKSMALLVVKAPGSRGAVRVSHAPTSISDVAATVLDVVGRFTFASGRARAQAR